MVAGQADRASDPWWLSMQLGYEPERGAPPPQEVGGSPNQSVLNQQVAGRNAATAPSTGRSMSSAHNHATAAARTANQAPGPSRIEQARKGGPGTVVSSSQLRLRFTRRAAQPHSAGADLLGKEVAEMFQSGIARSIHDE